MDYLSFSTGRANNTNTRVVSQSTNATNASQAAAFAMRLQDLLDLFWADVSIVVKGVKTFREGLLALRAEIALMSIGHLAVFMGLSMTTEPTFHCVSNVIINFFTLPNPHHFDSLPLNLVIAAIVLWNTVYLEKAVDYLQEQGIDIPVYYLQHLSPLGWEHINLTGDYVWNLKQATSFDKLRPLRVKENKYR